MKKRFIIIFGIIVFALIFLGTKSNAAVSINTKKVDLYAIDEIQENKYNLTIPNEYAQSYTLKITGNKEKPVFEVEGSDGEDAIIVDENGVITPKSHSVNYIGVGIYKDYRYGTYKVKVTVDGKEFEVEVNLINYPTIYAENVMKDYISKNINSSMTQYEKLDKICQFVASYEYSASASHYTSMILTGGGDCWASSYTILYMCEQVGIKAHLRYGVNDGGAGSGHRNVAALIDGKVYIAEAGFSEPAPRYYYIIEEKDGFDFNYKSDGTYKLVQYDGFNTNIVVPSTYNGKPVTEIGDSAFYYGNGYSEVEPVNITLPNTITTIGASAFQYCTKLEQVNIPSSVTDIKGALFTSCEKVNIKMDSPNYVIIDKVIYDKNKTKVIECLATKTGEVVLPNTVTTIGRLAFYKTNAGNVVLGNNVKTIEEQAFYQAKIKGITIPKGVTSIGKETFYYSELRSFIMEEGCKATIGDYALSSCYSLGEIAIPSSVSSISDKAIEKMYRNFISGKSGSYAEQYAKSKDINFVAKNGNSISSQMIVVDNTEFDYNKKVQKPKVTIYYGSTILKEGTDYTCTLPVDMINAGSKEITIQGKGKYTGTEKINYIINKISNDFTFKCDDVTYGQKPNPVVLNNESEGDIRYYYASSEDSNRWSQVAPTEEGTYWVEAYAYGDTNHYSASKKVSFKIKPAPFKLGDVNRDGKVDSQDAVQVLKYVAHNISLDSTQLKAADTNKDGKVDSTDAVQILKYVAHNISGF